MLYVCCMVVRFMVMNFTLRKNIGKFNEINSIFHDF